MALHADAEAVLRLIAEAGHPEFWQLTVAEARQLFERTMPVLDSERQPVHQVADRVFDGPEGALALRVYRPSAAPSPLPIVVYYHGGGFVVGGLESYDSLCRRLANGVGAVVVSVDYRLAPEHKFPAAVNDAAAALRWVHDNAAALGGDPGRVAVAGDSAGGNLAAVSAIWARDQGLALGYQVLIYPVVGGAPETASHHAFGDGYLLARRTLLWFYGHYLNDPAEAEDARFAPILHPDLGGLAPALIITAGHDPLRDEAVDYAGKLIAAGNQITLTNYAGMIHGFVTLAGIIRDGRMALAEITAALRGGLGVD